MRSSPRVYLFFLVLQAILIIYPPSFEEMIFPLVRPSLGTQAFPVQRGVSSARENNIAWGKALITPVCSYILSRSTVV